MPTGFIILLERRYFRKSQGEIGVEIKYLVKVFILSLLLSSCLLAEKGSILCWKQRLPGPGLASLITPLQRSIWHWAESVTLGVICFVGMQTSSWALAKANLEHNEGRNFSLRYPFIRVQKCGSHACGWGRQCLLLCWRLRRHQGCQEHHPSTSDICSVFAHHNLPKDNWVMFVLCFETWKKLQKYLCYYSHGLLVGLMILSSSVEILHIRKCNTSLCSTRTKMIRWNERNI